MANNLIVTRGFGNGTFAGTISRIVTRGYAIGEAAVGLSGKRPSVELINPNRYTVSRVGGIKSVVQVYD